MRMELGILVARQIVTILRDDNAVRWHSARHAGAALAVTGDFCVNVRHGLADGGLMCRDEPVVIPDKRLD
jgi:hypothetical protein